MNGWEIFIAVVIATIISAGGIGAAVTACISFLSDKIANRLEMKYQLKLDKELETLKTQLDNTNYISKAMFDVEFSVHQELSEAIYLARVKLALLLHDELYDQSDKLERINAEQKVSHEAGDEVAKVEKILYRSASFMPNEIFVEYEAIYNDMHDLYCGYSDRLPSILKKNSEPRTPPEDIKRLDALRDKITNNSETVRKYLRTLRIIEN